MEQKCIVIISFIIMVTSWSFFSLVPWERWCSRWNSPQLCTACVPSVPPSLQVETGPRERPFLKEPNRSDSSAFSIQTGCRTPTARNLPEQRQESPDLVKTFGLLFGTFTKEPKFLSDLDWKLSRFLKYFNYTISPAQIDISIRQKRARQTNIVRTFSLHLSDLLLNSIRILNQLFLGGDHLQNMTEKVCFVVKTVSKNIQRALMTVN